MNPHFQQNLRTFYALSTKSTSAVNFADFEIRQIRTMNNNKIRKIRTILLKFGQLHNEQQLL